MLRALIFFKVDNLQGQMPSVNREIETKKELKGNVRKNARKHCVAEIKNAFNELTSRRGMTKTQESVR